MRRVDEVLWTSVLFEPVFALGKDGGIVLGVFVPVIVLVIIGIFLKALWEWYQEQQVDEFIYDPFMDQMLLSRFPAIETPPKTTGRVIYSAADYPQTLDPFALQSRSLSMLQNDRCIKNVSPTSNERLQISKNESLQVPPNKTEPERQPSVIEQVRKETIHKTASMERGLTNCPRSVNANATVLKSLVFPRAPNGSLLEGGKEKLGSTVDQQILNVEQNDGRWPLPKNPYGEKMDDVFRAHFSDRESVSRSFMDTTKCFNKRGFLVKRKKTLHMRFEKKASMLKKNFHKRILLHGQSSREFQKRVNLSDRRTLKSISSLCDNPESSLELQDGFSINCAFAKIHKRQTTTQTRKMPKSSLKVQRLSTITPVKTVTFHKSCKGSKNVSKMTGAMKLVRLNNRMLMCRSERPQPKCALKSNTRISEKLLQETVCSHNQKLSVNSVVCPTTFSNVSECDVHTSSCKLNRCKSFTAMESNGGGDTDCKIEDGKSKRSLARPDNVRPLSDNFSEKFYPNKNIEEDICSKSRIRSKSAFIVDAMVHASSCSLDEEINMV